MPSPSIQTQPNHDGRASVVTRIEVLDDAMAEVLKRKTPAERLAIGFGLWRSARTLLRGQLSALHPEWTAAQLDREVARRLSHGAV